MKERPAPPQLASQKPAPGLYLVATPIGNLRDVTLRALDILSTADLVLAEDTRVTHKLLAAYGIQTRLERYDEHSDARVRPKILQALSEGKVVAIVSDAGTPLVSDPGSRLVSAVIELGSPVIPVPGASAALAALTMAGLPTDRFMFAGFAPTKAGARRQFFQDLSAVDTTLIFYETGPRLRASLQAMLEIFGPRPAAVARELTKLYETCIRGTLDQLSCNPDLDGPRGEIVVLVGPPAPEATDRWGPAMIDAALAQALRHMPVGAAAAEVAAAAGLGRRALYQRALELKSQSPSEDDDPEPV